jgi:hypothetical protein
VRSLRLNKDIMILLTDIGTSSFHLRTETDPLAETFVFYKYILKGSDDGV